MSKVKKLYYILFIFFMGMMFVNFIEFKHYLFNYERKELEILEVEKNEAIVEYSYDGLEYKYMKVDGWWFDFEKGDNIIVYINPEWADEVYNLNSRFCLIIVGLFFGIVFAFLTFKKDRKGSL